MCKHDTCLFSTGLDNYAIAQCKQSSEVNSFIFFKWTGDADLRFYVTTVQDGWRRLAFLTRWNSVHLQVLLSATPQGGTFPEVSQQAAHLLRSWVRIPLLSRRWSPCLSVLKTQGTAGLLCLRVIMDFFCKDWFIALKCTNVYMNFSVKLFHIPVYMRHLT